MNAADFLQTLYGGIEDGFLETTFISPPEIKLYPRTVVLWRQMPMTNIDPKMPKIHALNDKGYGAYFGLAVRKDRKHPEKRVNKKDGKEYTVFFPRGWQVDSKYLTAFFADVDAKDFGGDTDKALAQVKSLKPSIIVQTGGGFHGYMLLEKPLLITDENRGAVKRTLKGISKAAGSDPHVAELARVFRLPDTINTKPERAKARCEVIYAGSERYDYEDLYSEYAPLIPVNTTRASDRVYLVGDDEVERALNHIPAHTIPYDDWIRVLAGLTHSLGSGKALSLAERWTGYCSQSGEVESKVSSFEADTGSQTATVGSVFHLAKQFGYTAPPRDQRERSLKSAVNSAISKLQAEAAF